MKKSELKNIIKECVKEVIFEEGVLSGIITEVAQGLQGVPVLQEATPSRLASSDPDPTSESKRRVLAAVGSKGYEDLKKRFADPSLFEGTTPIPQGDGRGPMAGVAPGDPGVDISNIPGRQKWAHVASSKKE